MRKLILSIICTLFLAIAGSAQNKIDYPRFAVDSLGQVIVEMTIEQAQKLDNNTDMLELFQQLNMQLDNYDSVCVRVINDKDIVIGEQKMEIAKLKELAETKDQQIVLLQGQIADYIMKEILYNQQLENDKKIMQEQAKQIRQAKTKTIITGTVLGAIIIGTLTGLIYLAAH